MSKPIPKKQRQVKSFAKAVIALWPRATWVPDKENADGEKTRSLKLTLSTEPGNLNGKNYSKLFKIYRSGTPEEWILWRRDFTEVCTGMALTTGPSHNRMIHQLLTDEPLKEFERALATFATNTVERCKLSFDTVAETIFPANAYAKQKKYIRQGMWKPRTLTIRKVYTRLCELNAQLLSYPNQTGVLPEDEMKSAFINILAPDWQQEFLKTGINEYSSTWEQMLSKAEALEQAEGAIAELAPAKEDKHDREEGDNAPRSPPAKKQKKSFYCRMHGPDQRHNTDDCKVINAEIEKLKGKKPSFNNQQEKKPNWSDRKRTATSYLTEQMKDVVRLTRKKAMVDAKSLYEEQLQEELHAIEIRSDASEQKSKMQIMELFINNPDGGSDMEGGDDDLTQAEIDELTTSISNE
jgi:hypothetical protein